MKFIYILAGWEELASNSRVLHDAMSQDHAFVIPIGKYYIVDARYTNESGFLAPYRSTRYHLNEWAAQGHNPSTTKELFNLHHSTARNVIERTFGLLKIRWAILRSNSYFDLQNQNIEKSKKSCSDRGYISWNDDMEKALLDTFVEYYNKGDRCQNGWKSHVYTATLKNVREKCHVDITKNNIMLRNKTFNKHYTIINGMRGFGWDWNKNKISVDSVSVWEAYVAKNKEATGYTQDCLVLGLN
ncbi:uncharacterized protein LOC101775412 [Setaria italica]|uniref:uncharacterized protein LOC101775412 n=1 Tax=Setaria italica TaxID=4555 RepID=UPI000BE4C718|nr:uncharacterized protein LOC101775412 [Setaria italica]